MYLWPSFTVIDLKVKVTKIWHVRDYVQVSIGTQATSQTLKIIAYKNYLEHATYSGLEIRSRSSELTVLGTAPNT